MRGTPQQTVAEKPTDRQRKSLILCRCLRPGRASNLMSVIKRTCSCFQIEKCGDRRRIRPESVSFGFLRTSIPSIRRQLLLRATSAAKKIFISVSRMQSSYLHGSSPSRADTKQFPSGTPGIPCRQTSWGAFHVVGRDD